MHFRAGYHRAQRPARLAATALPDTPTHCLPLRAAVTGNQRRVKGTGSVWGESNLDASLDFLRVTRV